MSQLVQDPNVSLDEIAHFLAIVNALQGKNSATSKMIVESQIITEFIKLQGIKKLDFFTPQHEEKRFLSCSTCFKVGGIVFSSWERLVEHIQIHHPRQGAKDSEFLLYPRVHIPPRPKEKAALSKLSPSSVEIL